MVPFALSCLLAAAASAQAPAMQVEKGAIIPRVACAAKPEQSYALYLPSNYSPERRWPVIFAFDPAARGSLPVGLLKDAAEKYGYIVAGSNNSQNGPVRAQVDAAEAMMRDVTSRFSVDARRMYTTGFSGGSRVAATVALLCGDCIAGVFAHGAGFPIGAKLSRDVKFVYFATIGDVDFNYPEVVELTDQLREMGVLTHLRVFAGPHRWAPAEVFPEALAWFELRAMAEGRRPRDEEFIRAQLADKRAHAESLEKSGDLYGAYRAYDAIAQDFAKLADLAPFEAKVAELKSSDAVRDARRREEREFERQRTLFNPFAGGLESLRQNPAERQNLMPQLFAMVSGLRSAKSKDPSEQRTQSRTLAQMFAHSYEAGEDALQKKEYAYASACFELAREARPDAPGPPYGLARAYAATGRKKQALEAVREAVRKGLRNAELLRTTPELAALKDDPQFQRILESIASTAGP